MENENRAKIELSAQEAKRQAEAKAMVEKINDPRLRADEHLEYFTIHFKDKIRQTPKRRIGDDINVNKVIEERLRKILREEV